MFMYGKKQAAKESKAKTNIMELCVTGHGIPLFYFYIYRICIRQNIRHVVYSNLRNNNKVKADIQKNSIIKINIACP